jgi:hypothetical protein
MSTRYRYSLPVEQTKWKFDGQSETCFTWEYDDSRAALLQLYDKGKKQQWDAGVRIDWSLDLDPENPMMLDDRVIPIFGTDVWKRMTEKERREASPAGRHRSVGSKGAGGVRRNGCDRVCQRRRCDPARQ